MEVSLNGVTPKSSIFLWDCPLKTIHLGIPPFMETSIYTNRGFEVMPTNWGLAATVQMTKPCDFFGGANYWIEAVW